MQGKTAGKRRLSREERAQRITEAWKEHYQDIIEGEVTLAEILQHPDEKLIEVADRALRMLKVGKLESAGKILLGLPLLDPYVPYFHLLLGVYYEKVQDQESAFDEYDQGVELCESMEPPGSLLPCLLVAKAKILIRLEQYPEALSLLQQARTGPRPIQDRRLWGEAQAMFQFLKSQIGDD